MAHQETYNKGRNDCQQVEAGLRLPTYHATPTCATSQAITTKSRLLTGLAVALAGFISGCLSVYLILQSYPDYTWELQAYSLWKRSLPRFKTNTDGCISSHWLRKMHGFHNGPTSITNVTLAGRQRKKRYAFHIPITAEKYRFVSSGWIDKSIITVIPFNSDQKLIRVDVEILKDPQNIARIFKLSANGGGKTNGVGFQSSEVYRLSKNWPAFRVTVRIPVNGNQQESLNSFETQLNGFAHQFKDLSKSFIFSHIYTSTTRGRMDFESVKAKNLVVFTNNEAVKLDKVTAAYLKVFTTSGPIRFHNVVASSMSARTSSGPIMFEMTKATTGHIKTSGGEVSGKLWSDNWLLVQVSSGKIRGEYTLTKSGMVKLTATNGMIFGRIRLRSKGTDSATRPSYHVVTSNRNSPVTLKVLEQPADSDCSVTVSSTSAAKVEMPPTFQGRFSMMRIRGKVVVKGKNDPTGRGRRRFVKYDRPGSTASGLIGWGSAGDKGQHVSGEVRISTTNGPAELIFN